MITTFILPSAKIKKATWEFQHLGRLYRGFVQILPATSQKQQIVSETRARHIADVQERV
jgi:hypothetical protein